MLEHFLATSALAIEKPTCDRHLILNLIFPAQKTKDKKI
jgi:hypothetical protein